MPSIIFVYMLKYRFLFQQYLLACGELKAEGNYHGKLGDFTIASLIAFRCNRSLPRVIEIMLNDLAIATF